MNPSVFRLSSFTKTITGVNPSLMSARCFPRRPSQFSLALHPKICRYYHQPNRIPLINPPSHSRQVHGNGPDRPRLGSAKSLKLSPEGARRLRNVNRLTTGLAIIFIVVVCEGKGVINIRGFLKTSAEDEDK